MMNNDNKQNLVKLAHMYIYYAYQNHFRKDGYPYVSYLEDVVSTLHLYSQKYKNSEVIYAATYLHSILEDKKITKEELFRIFGKEITQIVQSLTENKEEGWKIRKEKMVLSLKNGNVESKIVKAACSIENMNSWIKHFNNTSRYDTNFSHPLEDLLWFYQELSNIFIESDPIFKFYKQTLLSFENNIMIRNTRTWR